MKRIYILLTVCLGLVACKKIDVGFTVSPNPARAGQSVVFTNQSSGGEEWAWTFGDGSSSTLKSPSHTYKKPGTYTVTLMVDNKKSLRSSASLQVYDTIPTFNSEDTVFAVYLDYTFKAEVYNPYNYTVDYEWMLPIKTIYAQVTDTTMNSSTLHLYFVKPMADAPIWLRVVLNGDTTLIQKSFTVANRATNSVLIRNGEGDWRQRIFGKRAEMPVLDATAAALLDAEQDTMQIYNGYAFYLSDMRVVFPELEGFHISSRKFYYRTVDDGLWVANIDGSCNVQIDSLDCHAMTLDDTDNRIYWANDNGVWYMPFIGSDNNQFVTVPTQLNSMTGVTRLAADPEKK